MGKNGRKHNRCESLCVLPHGLTAIGIAVSAVTACLALSWESSLWLILPAIVASFFGVYIARNDDPVVAIGGYLLVAVSFGFITGPVVAEYTAASAARILFLTTMIIVGLGMVGAAFPGSLASWWSWLLGGLLVLLAGQFLLPLASSLGIPFGNAITFWDWAGIALFSFFVVFDLNRAMRIPYTMNNAIACAVEVYLDFINLFLRILSQSGDSDNV